MSAYQKSIELNLTGTDSEKVAILRTLTVTNIPVRSVRTWFREQSLWLERSNGQMMGPLQTAYEAANQQAKDGLDYLYDTVFAGSAEVLRTTDAVWAPRVKALVDLVVQLSPQASGLVDSFYALDGGRPYKDLTVEQFEAQRTAAESQAAKMALRLRIDTAWNQIGTPEQATAANTFEAIAAELRG